MTFSDSVFLARRRGMTSPIERLNQRARKSIEKRARNGREKVKRA